MTKTLMLCVMPMLLLGACAPPPPEPSLVLVHGPAEVYGATPTWCYSTLADADCYTERSPEATDRLIGAYLPLEPSPEPTAE
jgi:hypothetical protein